MTATIQVPEIQAPPLTMELTPEVIAFARAVVALVDGPPPPPNPHDRDHFGVRYLFNVRTRRLHNRGCRSVEGSVPLTSEEIEAITSRPYGCQSCGTWRDDGVLFYDMVLISPTGVKRVVQ